jgi:hypothetical protein
MNGNGARKYSYSSSQDSEYQGGSPRYEGGSFGRPPPSQVLLDGYKDTIAGSRGMLSRTKMVSAVHSSI